jgi:acyl-CoA reductase-like NAD-dependent aldehyde dehydrogenase
MSTTATPSAPLAETTRACRLQQEAWSRLPLHERLRPVRALRRLLVRHCDDLCAAVARDLGKTTEETLGGDILPVAEACRFLEREAPRLLRPRRVPASHRPLWLFGQADVVHRRPRGLIGLIGTWNYPLLLNGVPLVQALTAGNGVVWKPSEVAPASARALFALLEPAGYPPGLVQLLDASRDMGRVLAEADVDHVCFTGSTTTGRDLAENLSRRLVSSTLELSGCDALFVLEDADVPLAARAAWFGATINRGQTCLAVRRVFVQRGVYPVFADAVASLAASAAPVRLALSSQVRHARRLVEEALAEGGRLLGTTGLPPGDGDAMTPLVVAESRPEFALCRETSFAPLLGLLPFDTLEEALVMDRQCPYGLGASIFTRTPARAAWLAERLCVGMVAVNDVVVPTAHPATPFGGRGASGWGVTQGAEGLLEMTVPQVVSLRGGSFRPHYGLTSGRAGSQEEVLRGFLDWGHASGLARRWGGLIRALRALWRGR